MKLEVQYNGQVQTYDIEAIPTAKSGVINIGRKCKNVWNTIAIDSDTVDPFQCQLIGCVGGSWRITDGQNRTECPKGLLSSKVVPCNGCLGRCVNIHAGRPKYYQRIPQTATLINGMPIKEYGSTLNIGDIITIGDVAITVG